MATDLLQFVLYVVALTALAWPLGLYMARVFSGERTWLTPVVRPVERGLLRACGLGAEPAGQHWSRYALAALAFNLAGWLVLYAVLRLQDVLPLNPQDLPRLTPDLAFNTAVSFVTNTNWQAYGGETTMSYLSQMVGLTVQNFVSAATGIAVAVAVVRGVVGRETRAIGNFWADLVRSILYLLLPLSIVFGLFLVWQGVPQNLDAYVEATTLEGVRQVIAQGPAAAQIAIKQLGTNGGGFFNANSAVPYENPTPLTNFVEMLAILLIPAAFPFLFGRMVKDMRQGVAIFAAMLVLFLGALALTYGSEIGGNPLLADLPVDQSAGSLEGKEVRFGTGNSALWATATTAASNGSVNAMHDSFKPLAMLAPMLQIQTGEVVFGGVGSGFYGMLAFVLLTVFLAGLMVGRTPEYLGKKIEAREVKLAVIAFLVMPLGVLGFGALAAAIPSAAASAPAAGPHGLSEILYAYSSATGNNGSAFAGFSANTVFHNTLLGIAMLLGRYVFIVPMLAVAGSLAAKKTVPASAGTFPTHTMLFVTLLVAVILIIGGLTFFPVLALGPIAEHVAMLAGQSF
ncbi:potassium-transporting ATPase subunit KdpA [Mangrovibrevibacter kandeliae]|uniref:potassium-transporting ATPase subunit KdpA n=1 Tax=Mangrovibrevibacter kandeliae TaxID=2968473 RepID=UPI0021177B44|nr:potassium-transporting ATPase subunit KdpA [Aurantimonas sp. CSK15Z-1]MCQ8781877.1 potassium-transporting ATPase subunit KdpA [Aurantimonas sp. CSK15Z-1]